MSRQLLVEHQQLRENWISNPIIIHISHDNLTYIHIYIYVYIYVVFEHFCNDMQLDKRWTVLGSCEGNRTRSCWLKPLLPVRTMIYKCWVENHTEYVSLLMLGISRDMNNILTCTFIYCYILLLTIYVNMAYYGLILWVPKLDEAWLTHINPY